MSFLATGPLCAQFKLPLVTISIMIARDIIVSACNALPFPSLMIGSMANYLSVRCCFNTPVACVSPKAVSICVRMDSVHQPDVSLGTQRR